MQIPEPAIGQWPNIAIDPRTRRKAVTGEEVERDGGKTATERLRELLDERGITWWESKPYGAVAVTKFDMRGITLRYVEYPNYCWLDYHEDEPLTPEQAISATLGAGECKVQPSEELRKATDECIRLRATVRAQAENFKELEREAKSLKDALANVIEERDDALDVAADAIGRIASIRAIITG